MNDELVVTDLPEDPSVATEKAQADSPETYDSSPLREFFYGKKTDLSDQEIEDLNTIWGFYARGSSGPGETIGKIRDMERSIVAPPVGVSRIQHMLSYIRLMQDEEDIQKAKGAYHG